ncbi:MAG: cytosolic protein [Ardenticatenaceae bacterium]|nr:cytosolic protein [Anaerolineales bacterium]MCB8922854.1 cytosolic protein [Ardenticatenaceae bacterium]MCB9005433.1 cytosolic protein [Ardenticatenaceae bacterium]
MEQLELDDVRQYVNQHIIDFHQRKIASLEQLTLKKLLSKNPYLFKAKHITTAGQLMEGLLDAFLSSSEEKLFGDFLEGLAVFIAGKTAGGHKSTAQGIDLEFIDRGVHFVVSIKSGPNWGNSSQHKKLAQDLRSAVIRVKQARGGLRVEPVLGICYGKTRTSYTRDGYLKVVGQNFWTLISNNQSLYTDIIEPIGYRAKEHNEAFGGGRGQVVNKFTGQFITQFCDIDGAINWNELVKFNSGNYDLDSFLSLGE